MRKIAIADATLRFGEMSRSALGFKEKIEIVKQLDRLCVDVLETSLLLNGKTDILLLHSLLPLVENRVISCPVKLDVESVRQAWSAIGKARHPRLNLQVPVSTVQMEYCCHQKPQAVLDSLAALAAEIKRCGAELEVSFLDATRAEMDFLVTAVNTAVENGAEIITLCDSAGQMFAGDLAEFLQEVKANVPALENVVLSVECSNILHMAPACAVVCIEHGVGQIKTAIGSRDLLSLASLADILRSKAGTLGVASSLNLSCCDKIVGQILDILNGKNSEVPSALTLPSGAADWKLGSADDMAAINQAVKKLGYELSADDLSKVYEEFKRLAQKKDLGARDLDAIVAAVAMQVPPTYKLQSFVINSGNIISSMAHVVLLRGEEEVQGFSMGDGPIDAAFLSIENIVGRHFELDDFHINAVTEGREAVGSSVVRLRCNGKLYSGKGVSTDIIGAGIRAYVDALNKICHEENEN